LLPTPHKDGTMVPLQLHLAPLKSGRKWPWFANGLEQLCNHHFLMLHHPNQSLSWMVKPCWTPMFIHFPSFWLLKWHEIPWNPMKYHKPPPPDQRAHCGSAPAPRAGRWHPRRRPGCHRPHRTERLEMMGTTQPKRGELPVQTIKSWWFYQQK